MRARRSALLLAALILPATQLLYPGCATLFDGTTQKVRVKSKPVGAQVFVNGKAAGATPVTAVVSRWGAHRVRIEMPGFQPYEVPLVKRYNPNASANLFIGGVWIVIDALSGAIFALDVPRDARAQMLPQRWLPGDPGYNAVFSSSALMITVELKPAVAGRQIGQMKRR